MNDNYTNTEYQEPDYYAQYTNEKLKEARGTFSRFHLALFLYVAVAYASVIIAEFIMIAVMGFNDAAALIENNVYFTILFNFVPMYLIGFPVFFFVIFGMKTMKREKSKITVSEFLSLFLISQVALTLGSMIGETLNGFISIFKGESVVNQTDVLISGMPTWLILAIVVIVGPIVEELVFRKLMIDRFSRYGDAVAITVSSVSFGLFHGNFYQFFYAALLGIALSYIYVRSGKIIYPILLHIFINLFCGVLPSAIMSMMDMEQFLEMSLEGTITEEFIAANALPLAIFGAYELIYYILIFAGIYMLTRNLRNIHFNKGEIRLPKGQTMETVTFNPGIIAFTAVCILYIAVNTFAT
jgi:membrane protease YdiL (CAAX protease family)